MDQVVLLAAAIPIKAAAVVDIRSQDIKTQWLIHLDPIFGLRRINLAADRIWAPSFTIIKGALSLTHSQTRHIKRLAARRWQMRIQ